MHHNVVKLLDSVGNALGIDIERADVSARRFYRFAIALLLVIAIEFAAIDVLLLIAIVNLPS